MISQNKVPREKPIPEEKIELVKETSDKFKKVKTILLASCKSLPSSQFQEIKKKLRGKAEVKFMKKSAFNRAIDATEKGALQELKKETTGDFAVFFSDMDAFELSGLLSGNQVPTKAKPGDIAPEDIEIQPGPTDLPPGPAISELGKVGLKVAVKDGKLEIQNGAVVVKSGEEINEAVASVLGKLDISPIKVGFLPLAAYDSGDDKVFSNIRIDKEGTLEEMRSLIGKALNFAINVSYMNEKTIRYFISKAAGEERALSTLVESKSEEKPVEEKKEEKTETAEEKPAEEKKEGSEDNGQTQEDTKEESK